MYVSEICAEGFFVTFPWLLKNVKSRSKIALFSNECHFEVWFPKLKTITFFWSKLSKLHKKNPILHVATTFSLEQGETRTSHGPIPHPLMETHTSLVLFQGIYSLGHLTAHNWQKWKRVFLTCLCHEIYRNEAFGLKSCKYTWKITIFVKMWNLGQYPENLILCQ